MKKFIYKILSFCLAFLFAIPFTAMAEEAVLTDINVSYNRDTRVFQVSGAVSMGINIDEPARFVLLKPAAEGKTPADVVEELNDGSLNFVTQGIHIDETPIESDLTFVFASVTLPELPVGDYIVHVATYEGYYTETISIATTAQALGLMNNVSDGNVVAENIVKYNDVYGLAIDEGSDYKTLSDEGKDYVHNGMCSKTYAGPDEIGEIFDLYTQLYKIYDGPWGAAQAAVENHYGLLEIDLDEYTKLSSTYRAEAVKALVGTKFEGVSDFGIAFEAAVADAADNQKKANQKNDNKGPSPNGPGRDPSMQVEIKNEGKEQTDVKTDTIPKEVFDDLTGYDWAKESVYELYGKGIINGKANGVFAPADSITRAEAIKMVVMAFGGLKESAQADFSDVPKNSWMHPYIATAVERGIVMGLGDGSVGAEAEITREDFATMVVRAAKIFGMQFDALSDVKFKDDIEISDYAREAVYGLKNENIINGVGDNTYMPKAVTTRAQAAKIIASMI